MSPAVWSRIANVLQLARAERAYMFELAEYADPQHPRDAPGGAAAPILQSCMDVAGRPQDDG